jgi:hypothetical protein
VSPQRRVVVVTFVCALVLAGSANTATANTETRSPTLIAVCDITSLEQFRT